MMAEQRYTQAQSVRGMGLNPRVVEVIEALQREVVSLRGRLDAADGLSTSTGRQPVTGQWSPNAAAAMFNGSGIYQNPVIQEGRYLGGTGFAWFALPLPSDPGERRNARVTDVSLVVIGGVAGGQIADVVADARVVRRFAVISRSPQIFESGPVLLLGLAVVPASGVTAVRIASLSWRID